MKSDRGDYLSEEVLSEIDLESKEEKEKLSSVLSLLTENSQDFGRVEPPPGYEAHLLTSLSKKVQRRSKWRRFWSSFTNPIEVPRWLSGMALSCVMIVGSFYIYISQPTVDVGMSAVLVEQFQEGNQRFAKRWLASVSGSAVRQGVLGEDPVAISMEMEIVDLERALKDVAMLVPSRGSE